MYAYFVYIININFIHFCRSFIWRRFFVLLLKCVGRIVCALCMRLFVSFFFFCFYFKTIIKDDDNVIFLCMFWATYTFTTLGSERIAMRIYIISMFLFYLVLLLLFVCYCCFLLLIFSSEPPPSLSIFFFYRKLNLGQSREIVFLGFFLDCCCL